MAHDITADNLVMTPAYATTEWNLAPTTNSGKLLLVRVGNKDRPASEDDINNVNGVLKELLGDLTHLRVWVTHHAVSLEVFEIPVSAEFKISAPASEEALGIP